MVVVSDMKEGSRCELGMFIGWRHLIDNTSEAEQGDNNASFLLPTHTRLMLLSHCASRRLFVALTLIHPPASHERRTSRLAQQHCWSTPSMYKVLWELHFTESYNKANSLLLHFCVCTRYIQFKSPHVDIREPFRWSGSARLHHPVCRIEACVRPLQ